MPISADQLNSIFASDALRITWKTDTLVTAQASDGGQIHTVQWTSITDAWTCTCGASRPGAPCGHIAVVHYLTAPTLHARAA